ncbi:NUDIX hydrolase [Paenibacillus dakarensis]|uniref:NUDIX hydrolase n=1 Tax=Paenibacillus dakarensis TaxID=1527293 RepID=UPI0006D57870|nr:NUDIX domain-containing protein [Paenibacillus dakarensis]
MRLIGRITDRDILGGTPEFLGAVSRYASRGVLVDDEMNVAMMYMSKLNLYKLPGGGVEGKETLVQAFLREIREETGYEAEVVHELGYIEEHKSKNDFMQLSYCWIARAQRKVTDVNLSESEQQLGMSVNWMTFKEAIEVMNESLITCTDYSTRFMILRDKTILDKAYLFWKELQEKRA